MRFANDKSKIIVIGCKKDLGPSQRMVSKEKGKEFCLMENKVEDRHVYGGECSGKTGEGVEEVMAVAIDKFFERFEKCDRWQCPVLS